MRRTSRASEDVIARGCRQALYLAGDPNQLASAPCDQLGVAAAFLARALRRFDDRPAGGLRSNAALLEIETAGNAIGAELRRRAFE